MAKRREKNRARSNEKPKIKSDPNFDANFDNPGLPSDEEAIKKRL